MNRPTPDQPDTSATRTPPGEAGWAQRVFGGRYRWWWRAGLATLLLAMIPVVLLLHYTRPVHLKPLLEARLSRQLGGPVTIGQARMSLTGQLTLESVWLEVPTPEPPADTPTTNANLSGDPGKSPATTPHDTGTGAAKGLDFAKLAEVERIEVQLGLSGLLRGELRVQELRLVRPQLHVIEDVERGVLNLEMLRPEARPQSGLRLKLPPVIDLDAARVRFAEVRSGRLRTLEAMRLAGELRERPAGSRRYDFTLRQYDESARVGATLSGRFDAGTPALELNLDGFEMAMVHRQLLPEHLRRWWDLVRPAGRLPRLRLQMQADGEGRLRLQEATLDLAEVSVTPPWAALDRAGLIPPPPPPTRRRQAATDGPLRVAADGSYVPVTADEANTPSGPADAPPRPADATLPTATGRPPQTRMTRVSGQVVARRDEVELHDLTGVIEGVRFHVQGRWGMEPGAGSQMKISTDPFVLEPEPPYLPALPEVARVLHHRLEPSGRFQLATKLTQVGPGRPVEVQGTLKVLGARSRFHEFPYPLQDVRGLIRFDRESIRLESLVARGPAGGTVTLDGEISPPSPEAGVRLSITGRDLPLDDSVRAALKPEQRSAVAQLFDAELHAALIDEGVIRAAAGAGAASQASADPGSQPDPTSAPGQASDIDDGADPVAAFDPGGRVNVRVLVDKPRGRGVKPAVTTRLDAAGLRVLFRHWPYPLIGRSGQVVIQPGRVDLEGVEFTGLSGGRGVLAGHLEADPADSTKLVPHLRARGELPIDALLRHAIRGDARQAVDDLHARGRVVGEAVIDQPAGLDRPRWRVEGRLDQASAQPYAGRFRLSQIDGEFTLGPGGLEVHRLAGQRGHARVELSGALDWAGDPRRASLRLAAEGLRVEPALLDVLPPGSEARDALAKLFADHAPDGVTDLQLTWDRRVPAPVAPDPDARVDAAATPAAAAPPIPAAESDFTLTLQPKVLEANYRGDRLRFPSIAGEVVVHPTYARLKDLDLRFATGTTTLRGVVGLDGQTPTALSLKARATAACPYTRKFLPPAVVAVMNQLDFAGDFYLQEARLYHRPTPTLAKDGSGNVDPTAAPAPADAIGADDSASQAKKHDAPAESDPTPTLEFDAKIQLTGARLTAGLPVTELQGQLKTRVRRYADEARPRLELTLDAEHLRLADRRIAPLRLTLDNQADPERLALRDAMGGVYGGVLVIEGSLPLDSRQNYRLGLTLSDVEVDPFLRPAEADPTYGLLPARPNFDNAATEKTPAETAETADGTPTAKAMPVRRFSNQRRRLDAGLLSASLMLESPMDRPAQRLGRGALQVRDARLYDKPLSTALLRATSFALPSGAPLDAASARYLVDGPTVYFDQLSMSGPGIRIEGGGTLSLPETALDLVMVPRATAGPRLGPISDLIDFFKDELIAIHVTGTIADPQTDVASLTGLTRGWTDSFGPHRATLNARDEIDGP